MEEEQGTYEIGHQGDSEPLKIREGELLLQRQGLQDQGEFLGEEEELPREGGEAGH